MPRGGRKNKNRLKNKNRRLAEEYTEFLKSQNLKNVRQNGVKVKLEDDSKVNKLNGKKSRKQKHQTSKRGIQKGKQIKKDTKRSLIDIFFDKTLPQQESLKNKVDCSQCIRVRLHHGDQSLTVVNIAHLIKKLTGTLPVAIRPFGLYKMNLFYPKKKDAKFCEKRLNGKSMKYAANKVTRTGPFNAGDGTHKLSCRILGSSAWDGYNSKCIRIVNLKANTSRYLIAKHIQKHAALTIEEKDIYLQKHDASSLNKLRSSAYIQCTDHQQAQYLVEKLNLTQGLGVHFNAVWVQLHGNGKGNSRFLQLSNLSQKVTEEKLSEHIRKMSSNEELKFSVEMKRVGVNHEMHRKRGLAIVSFESKKDAEIIGEKLNGTALGGQEVCVAWRVFGDKERWYREDPKRAMIDEMIRKEEEGIMKMESIIMDTKKIAISKEDLMGIDKAQFKVKLEVNGTGNKMNVDDKKRKDARMKRSQKKRKKIIASIKSMI